MRPLHIIIPMAGEGSRFAEQGYKTPKPLIDFEGKALFERSVNSLANIKANKKYSFIVRDEHITQFQIDRKIKDLFNSANIYSVAKTTKGAVETCLVAKEAIDPDDAILVLDCDLEFKSIQLYQKIQEILSLPSDKVNGGVLLSFESEDPRYSYAEVDRYQTVIRTAEKDPISKNALIGAYFFSKGVSFLDAATALISDGSFNKKEYYLSLLYNYLIAQGDTVSLVKADSFYSYGTPEELKSLL